jgi:hypothetical protein
MTRSGKLIATVWFSVFLSVPIIAGILGVTARTAENRAPAPLPTIGAGDLLDAETYRQVAAYLGDRLPFRGDAIKADARIDLDVYSDNPNPDQVHLGEDDWLFFAGTWTKPCTSQISGDQVVEELAKLERIVTASGREARVVVAPDKMTIYPEKFGPAIDELPACTTDNRARLQAGLQGGEVDGYVDLWDVLPVHRPDKIYYRGDTHWTPYGASFLVQEVVESIRAGIWQPEALVRARGGGRLAGTAAVLGLPRFESADVVRVARPGVAIENVAEWRQGDEGLEPVPPEEHHLVVTADGTNVTFGLEPVARSTHPRHHITSSGGAMIDGTTTVIHDSFLWDPLELLPQYFTDLRTSHWDVLGTDEVAEDLRAADLVILQTVERLVYERMEPDGGSLDALLTAYRDDLGAVEMGLSQEIAAASSDVTWTADPTPALVTTSDRAAIRLPDQRSVELGTDRYLLVRLDAPEPTRALLQVTAPGEPFADRDPVARRVDEGSGWYAFDVGAHPDGTRFRLRPRLEDTRVEAIYMVEVKG